MNPDGSTMTHGRGSEERAGWVFYDGECSFCTTLARRWRAPLRARGFELVPLQTPGVEECLGVPREELLSQMWVLTSTHEVFGGAEAFVYLARTTRWTWWAWPLSVVSRLPFGMRLISWVYTWIAAHRYYVSGTCSVEGSGGLDQVALIRSLRESASSAPSIPTGVPGRPSNGGS